MQSIVKLLEDNRLPIHHWHHLLTEREETKNCAFLDSSLKNSLGQFSILGAFPYTILEDWNGKLYENGEEKEETFIERINAFLKENKAENPTKNNNYISAENPTKDNNYISAENLTTNNNNYISFTRGGSSQKNDKPPLTTKKEISINNRSVPETDAENEANNTLFETASAVADENFTLPLAAGGIIYLTYDYGRSFENIKSQHKQEVQMPGARAAFYDLLLIQRESDGSLFLCTQERLHSTEWYEDYLDRISGEIVKILETYGTRAEAFLHENTSRLLKNAEKNQTFRTDRSVHKAENHRPAVEVSSDFDRDDYYDAIKKMMDYMEAGDIYVANMTRQILVKSNARPLDVFEILRKRNPSPFGGYFDLGDTQIICASPERFLKVTDGVVKTRPIKGTRKRGATPEEDAYFRSELENSDKDKSELLMIVDLERNDLNRVCLPGTVKVPEMFTIEEYATVFHLVSEIHGQLPEGKNAADLLKETFPGGSITGTPKIRAMEIIDELEHSSRGMYTGSLGYISFDGDCDLNIVIRTAVHQDGIYHIGAGGGITYESDVEFEYEETNQKAHAVVEAIRTAGSLS